MGKIYIYRNCFTGDLSGGDKHMVGVCLWLNEVHPNTVALIRPAEDGQEQAYPDTELIKNITYKSPRTGSAALLYVIRAILGTIRVRLAWDDEHTILIASSHFLPDVLPIFLKARRIPKITRAVYIHHIIQDMDRPKSFANSLANMQERFCFFLIRKRFDKVIVVNQAVAARLSAFGFRKQHILVSSNFVDAPSKLYPQPYDKKDITLIFCGRFVTQKGIDDFITVCADLEHRIDGFNAVMVGTGPEFDRIQTVVNQKNLPVKLVGFVEDAEKFAFLLRSKLFVFPSIEEGWGIVIAEAFATGVPVIAYDLTVYKEVFGEAVHTVAVGDRERLVAQTYALLNEYSREETYAQEQERLVALTQQFTRDTVARSEYEFLQQGEHDGQ